MRAATAADAADPSNTLGSAAMDFAKILSGLDTDAIAEVVQLVIANRDVIARLGELPEVFEQFSDSLAGAGREAKEAAVALVGADGSRGARGVLDAASTSLTGVVATFGKGLDLLDDTARAAHKVPLMDAPASSMEGAAAEMRASTERLGDLADSLASMADILATVGTALAKVGAHLDDTSTQARGFLSVS